MLNYEAQTTSTLDQLELNTPFVLVVPQDILLKERSFIARMPNKSIILTRV